MKKLFRLLFVGSWEVVRVGWPYGSGYGTYHSRTWTLLDCNLTHNDAQTLADRYNAHGACGQWWRP